MNSQIALVYQPGDTLQDFKIEAIRQALIFFQGDKTATAKALDISVRGLRNLVKHDKRLSEFYHSSCGARCPKRLACST